MRLLGLLGCYFVTQGALLGNCIVKPLKWELAKRSIVLYLLCHDLKAFFDLGLNVANRMDCAFTRGFLCVCYGWPCLFSGPPYTKHCCWLVVVWLKTDGHSKCIRVLNRPTTASKLILFRWSEEAGCRLQPFICFFLYVLCGRWFLLCGRLIYADVSWWQKWVVNSLVGQDGQADVSRCQEF